MVLKYLQPMTGEELEKACEDKANAKFAKFIRKHYVFEDRQNYPTRPSKNAPRKEWREYEARVKVVNKAKADLHERKAAHIYTLYRDTTYVVGLNDGNYFIVSGNLNKEPVPLQSVAAHKNPAKFVGRRVQGSEDCVLVPFMGTVYSVNLKTSNFKEIHHG